VRGDGKMGPYTVVIAVKGLAVGGRVAYNRKPTILQIVGIIMHCASALSLIIMTLDWSKAMMTADLEEVLAK